MKNRTIRALTCSLAVVQLFAAPASALNSAFSYSYPVGQGTTYTLTEGKNNAGVQRANILTYQPNSTVVPRIVYTGANLYGSHSTILNAASYLETQSGLQTVGGINADFFVMSSGIPIGLVIDQGELISSDGWQYAIGFQADGTAVIGRPTAYMNISGASGQVSVSYFNKTRTTAGAYLLDRNYDSATHFAKNGTSIILERLDNTPARVGGTVRMKVIRTIKGSESFTIADNQMILTKSDGASVPTWVDFPDGEEVTLSVYSPDPAWNSVQYAVGGKLLMENGNVSTSGIDAAGSVTARSAAGIKADGSVVLFEIDGLQSGHSAGLTAAQLGEEMKALGCQTVLCLDGGGSSVMALRQPGKNVAEIISKPSDGSPRAVANYIFLLSNAVPDGITAHAILRPTYRYLLPGGSTEFSVEGVDASFGPAPAPSDMTFTAEGGTVDGQTFTAGMDPASATVTGSNGNVSGSMQVCITPAIESISLQSGGKDVNSLSVKAEQTVDLDALAYRMGARMGAQDALFTWTVSDSIGTVNENGVFTAGAAKGSGTLTCSYGGVNKSIPITVGMGDPQQAEIIATFDDPTFDDQTCTATDGLTLSRVTGSEAARGEGSLQASFDGTIAAENTIYLPKTNVSDMRYLSLWAKVSGVSGALTCVFETADGAELTAEIPTISSLWQQHATAIPDGAQSFTGLRFSHAGGGQTDSALLLDQIIATAHHAVDNTDAPLLQLDQSTLTVDAGASVTVTGSATMENNSFPVRTENVFVKLDGTVLPGAARMDGSSLTVTTGALDPGTHCLTIDVTDDAGNRARGSVTVTAGADANRFADTGGHWARGYASLLSELGVMQGEATGGQTYFRPDRNLKRMEFAVTLARMLGLDTSYSGALDFADDDAIPTWARGAVYAVSRAGIMNGQQNDGRTYFAPQAEMSRAEVMTVIGRILPRGFSAGPLSCRDASLVPSWALEHVQTCVSAGIIGGYQDNTIRPLGKITRGEIAKILALL